MSVVCFAFLSSGVINACCCCGILYLLALLHCLSDSVVIQERKRANLGHGSQLVQTFLAVALRSVTRPCSSGRCRAARAVHRLHVVGVALLLGACQHDGLCTLVGKKARASAAEPGAGRIVEKAAADRAFTRPRFFGGIGTANAK